MNQDNDHQQNPAHEPTPVHENDALQREHQDHNNDPMFRRSEPESPWANTAADPVNEHNAQQAQQPYQQPLNAQQQPYQQPPNAQQPPYQQPLNTQQQAYQQPQQPYQQPQQPYQQAPYQQQQQQQPYQAKPAEPGALGGLERNIASMLCYLFGWVTGLIFFFGDKRPEVRFHAAQSIVATGAISVVTFLLSMVRLSMWRLWTLFNTISTILSLATLALIVYMMVSAYQGKRVKLPIAGDIAENMSK